jgi:hypothetical protein
MLCSAHSVLEPLASLLILFQTLKITNMKSTFTKLTLTVAAWLAFFAGAAQTDLVPGMNYSYDPPGSDGIITNITVDACNNESDAASTFVVAMYLYDPNTTDYWVIGEYTMSGLSGNACNTISGWDININDNNAVPAGTFRLGVWVDRYDDIVETDDDNNYGLLTGNINYTPSAVGIKQQAPMQALLNDASPNPASDLVELSFHLETKSKVSLAIYDLTGKKVSEVLNSDLAPGDHGCKADVSGLAPGLYFYSLTTDGHTCSKKLVVR